jgi:hypothetical protein
VSDKPNKHKPECAFELVIEPGKHVSPCGEVADCVKVTCKPHGDGDPVSIDLPIVRLAEVCAAILASGSSIVRQALEARNAKGTDSKGASVPN